MLTNAKNWISHNKFTAALVVVVLYLVGKNLFIGNFMYSGRSQSNLGYPLSSSVKVAPSLGIGAGLGMDMAESYDASTSLRAPIYEETPITMQTERRVITNSSISLLVKDVNSSVQSVAVKTQQLGGYVVSKNIRTPIEGGSGYASIRIPQEKRVEMMEFLRDLGVKVLSENEDANDVTDQYEDLDAQLITLERTKTRFENIYEQAETVDDILNVQNQIMNIQRQIDNVKGRLKGMEARTQTTLISVQFTTDELALGYAPGDPWRPAVTFKLAVRSLTQALRSVGNAIIWLAVYSIFWLPVLLGVLVYKKRKNQK